MPKPAWSTGPAVVLGVGALLTYLAVTGDAAAYLSPTFVPLLGAAGLVLVGFALWELASRPSPAAGDTPHGHDHSGMPRIGWLLTVPVLLFALVGAQPLGAYSADRTVGQQRLATASGGKVYPPLGPDTGTVEMPLDEFTGRFLGPDPGNLDGRSVRLVGFVGRPPRQPGTVTLNRMKIYCCAGDALPQTALLEGAPLARAGDLREDQWVAVTGRLDRRRSGMYPVLVVDEVTRIDTPRNPYL